MEFHGLTEAQVRESREKYGSNQITEHNAESFWDKLKGNFDDPIIKILCVALALNVVFAFLGQAAWFEPVGIFGVQERECIPETAGRGISHSL